MAEPHGQDWSGVLPGDWSGVVAGARLGGPPFNRWPLPSSWIGPPIGQSDGASGQPGRLGSGQGWSRPGGGGGPGLVVGVACLAGLGGTGPPPLPPPPWGRPGAGWLKGVDGEGCGACEGCDLQGCLWWWQGVSQHASVQLPVVALLLVCGGWAGLDWLCLGVD